MPQMDGITAAQHLKKSMPDVPIILFTMHDLGPDRATQLGVDAVVSKVGGSALSKQVSHCCLDESPLWSEIPAIAESC